ncbi:MAG: alpha/beta-type small acid-soluble spore protein [Lachnospiraceae bacterium]|nr:alpha/beta-type small acid-soluble spore protein [Lachnospiraceae bacterium]
MAKHPRKTMDPEAKTALARFKSELANELGVVLHKESRKNGHKDTQSSIGNYMVDKMIESQQNKMSK